MFSSGSAVATAVIKNYKRAIFLLSGILATYFYQKVLMASGVPGLHWDATLYATVPINVATGVGWLFDSCAWGIILKPDRTYDWHGFLSVLIHGRLLNAQTWQQLCEQFLGLNTLAFVLWFPAFMPTQNESVARHAWGTAKALIASYFATLLQGRPEHLAVVMLAPAGLMWSANIRGKGLAICLSVTAGLLTCTSPSQGMLAAMMTAVVAASSYRSGSPLRLSAILTGLGVITATVTFLMVELFTPGGTSGWMKSMLVIGGTAPDLTPFLISPGKTMLLGVSVFVPLWNLVALSFIGYGAVRLAVRRNFVPLIGYSLLAWLVLRVAADYSFIAFFPLLLVVLTTDNLGTPFQKILRIVSSGLTLVWLTPSFVYLVISLCILQNGPRWEDMSNRIQAVCGDNSVIGYACIYRPSLVILRPPNKAFLGVIPVRQPDPNNSVAYQKLERIIGRRVEYVVYPQTYRGVPPADVYLGTVRFKRVYSNWTEERFQLFQIPFPGRKPGHFIAIYRRMATNDNGLGSELN